MGGGPKRKGWKQRGQVNSREEQENKKGRRSRDKKERKGEKGPHPTNIWTRLRVGRTHCKEHRAERTQKRTTGVNEESQEA